MPIKKATGWKILLFILGLTILAMLGFVVYGWVMERKAQFIRYEAFGIDIPVKYSIHGIDVSRYQSIIDWESVALMKVETIQLSFAFIKATEGVRNEDIPLQHPAILLPVP